MAEVFDALVIGGGPAGRPPRSCWRARAGRWPSWSERCSRAARSAASFCRPRTCRCSATWAWRMSFSISPGRRSSASRLFARDRQIVAEMPRLREEEHGWGRALGPGTPRHPAARARRCTKAPRSFSRGRVSRIRKKGSGTFLLDTPKTWPAFAWYAAARCAKLSSVRGSWWPRTVRGIRDSWSVAEGSMDPRGTPRRVRSVRVQSAFTRQRAAGRPDAAARLSRRIRRDGAQRSWAASAFRAAFAATRWSNPAATAPSLSAGEAVLAHIVATCPAARRRSRVRVWNRGGDLPDPFVQGSGRRTATECSWWGMPPAKRIRWWLKASAWRCSPACRWRRRCATTADLREVQTRLREPNGNGSFAWRIRVAAAIAHWAMRPAAVALTLPLLSAFPGMLTEGARTSGKVAAICSPSF